MRVLMNRRPIRRERDRLREGLDGVVVILGPQCLVGLLENRLSRAGSLPDQGSRREQHRGD